MLLNLRAKEAKFPYRDAESSSSIIRIHSYVDCSGRSEGWMGSTCFSISGKKHCWKSIACCSRLSTSLSSSFLSEGKVLV